MSPSSDTVEVISNPEKASEFVMDLRQTYDSLPNEQKRRALEKLREIKEQIAGLPEDQTQVIEAFIRDKVGL